MLITDLIPYIVDGFIYFLMGIGISTFFLPIKSSLIGFQGIMLGVGFTSSWRNKNDGSEIHYLYFQIHLLIFSLGFFINLGPK